MLRTDRMCVREGSFYGSGGGAPEVTEDTERE